jgi:hypothetical protein
MTDIAAAPISGAARRMRLHRQRRHDGLRYLGIELRETEINALTKKGLLAPDARNDAQAVQTALYALLEEVLA